MGLNSKFPIAKAKERVLIKAIGLSDEVSVNGRCGSLSFITAFEYFQRRERVEYLTTGCKALDDILGGGVETGSITELCGEYGTGKTQLCHQLCVTSLLPRASGGLNGAAVFLDTEGTFRPKRLAEIAPRFGLEPKQVLCKTLYARVYSAEQQMTLIDEVDEVIEEHNIRLIVIDSLLSLFRGEFIGRESLVERQQKLNRHLHQLRRVAESYNLAIVVTNQVLSVPEGSTLSFIKPAGGNIMAHGCTHRLWLRRVQGSKRAAKVFDSPNRPEAEALFIIAEDGVKDLLGAD